MDVFLYSFQTKKPRFIAGLVYDIYGYQSLRLLSKER